MKGRGKIYPKRKGPKLCVCIVHSARSRSRMRRRERVDPAIAAQLCAVVLSCCTVLFPFPFPWTHRAAFDYSDLASGCDRGGGNLILFLLFLLSPLTPSALTALQLETVPVTPHTSVCHFYPCDPEPWTRVRVR